MYISIQTTVLSRNSELPGTTFNFDVRRSYEALHLPLYDPRFLFLSRIHHVETFRLGRRRRRRRRRTYYKSFLLPLILILPERVS